MNITWLTINIICAGWLSYVITSGVAVMYFGDKPWPGHEYFWTALPLLAIVILMQVFRHLLSEGGIG